MQPLISVIIPVYRVESYLSACVESVRAQTYSTIEIILVDDGSPDDCPRMCDEFAARDSRIRVIHKENGGLSSARNAGIDAAKGDYLAFLDSDDLWTPVFLERLYQAIVETGADFAVCQFRRFQKEPPSEVPLFAKTIHMTSHEAFECMYNARNENMVVAPNKLYNVQLFSPAKENITAALNKLYDAGIFHGIRYPVGKLHEDEAVIHELIGRSKTVAWVDEAHYLYREAANSITTSKFNLRRLDEIDAKEPRIRFFEQREMPDLALKASNAYLSCLMRLYRTVLVELGNSTEATEKRKMIYSKFCNICTPELMKQASRLMQIRCKLFRYFPNLFSKLDYYRLKRKGIQ